MPYLQIFRRFCYWHYSWSITNIRIVPYDYGLESPFSLYGCWLTFSPVCLQCSFLTAFSVLSSRAPFPTSSGLILCFCSYSIPLFWQLAGSLQPCSQFLYYCIFVSLTYKDFTFNVFKSCPRWIVTHRKLGLHFGVCISKLLGTVSAHGKLLLHSFIDVIWFLRSNPNESDIKHCSYFKQDLVCAVNIHR